MMLKELNRDSAQAKQTRPIKILQFGEGNFLRAFVDWIVDILNEKTDFNSAVQIIQPIRNGMTDVLNAQEGLYHVVLKGITNGKDFSDTRLITCVSGGLNPYENFDAYLRLAENNDLKFIISNTTEAGITFNPGDPMVNVLAESFPGKLTQLLYHRFNFFKGDKTKGMILLPCELIEKNGETLKKVILQYADHWNLSKDFVQWISDANIFCNTLVDRIVPGFPKENIQEIQSSIGYNDKLVVKAEPFHLWVIETEANFREQFPVHKSALDVKIVKDLAPYRTRKVRILNGAHTALVPVAYLAGLRTVKESVENSKTGAYIRNTIFSEIIPTLDLPENELRQFANDVIERFQNPSIRHELLSIALNSISKFKVRVLPSILEYKKRTGKLPENLLYALAALIQFYKGEWRGHTIPLNDAPEVLDFFKKVWQHKALDQVVAETLANVSFWGSDLNDVEGLNAMVTAKLTQIQNLQSVE